MNNNEILDVMRKRHSVRQFTDRKIEEEKIDILNKEIDLINQETGMYFALCTDSHDAFKANKPHYGSFKNCRNYFVLFAPEGYDEQIGYYGEKLVLLAQYLGLNTCWVALTYEKKGLAVSTPEGMKLYIVIALGYGENQGMAHKSKPVIRLADITIETPRWFENGMDAVMLAPTAINQQRFFIKQIGMDGVSAKALLGPCSKIDLGIVKYHFELGAGKENFKWVE